MGIVHKFILDLIKCTCMVALMAIFVVFSVMTISGNAATFAPVEEKKVIQETSIGKGLKRADTRFISEELTQILVKSRSDDIRSDVSSALNTLNSRFEINGSEFAVESVRTDKKGNAHVHVVQRYKGIDVVGAEVNVILNKDGVVLAVTGFFAPELNMSIEPKLQSDDMIAVIRRDLGGDNEVLEGPFLVVYGGKLAYSVVAAEKSESPSKWKYYIDANSGSFLTKYSDIKY